MNLYRELGLAKPATQPAKPTSQPAKPTSQPAKPTSQPAKPASQPAKPVPQSQTSNTNEGMDIFFAVLLFIGFVMLLVYIFR